MSKSSYQRAALVIALGALVFSASAAEPPKGAKAIFDSGSGGTIGMSAETPRAPVVATEPMARAERAERYVGISYQILAIGPDGQMKAVPKSRVFNSGDRIRIVASTNRPGYLTVANIGTSGRMNVLFGEYVDARRLTQIPASGTLRFDGLPGTERILLMLSNEPVPFGGPGAGTQPVVAPAPVAPTPVAPSAVPAYSGPGPAYSGPAPTYSGSVQPPAYSQPASPVQPAGGGVENLAMLSPPGMKATSPDTAMVASLDGAKSLKAKGAKDLMVEDQFESSYAVISSRKGYQAVAGGAKDLVVETTPEGMNYGVIPVGAIGGGGILTLEINLRHR